MEALLEGLAVLFQPANFLFMFVGVTVGIIFGALPGLTATLGVAVMLSFTFGMTPTAAMFLLLGVYCGGVYGGSISAILINTPGTPASAATSLDGYALARKGRAGEALRMSVFASAFGGVFSAVALLLIAPQLARVALEFGPPEYFALALFGLTIIASVSGPSVLRGMIMGVLGLMVATVGLDPIEGLPRMDFGLAELAGGVELIPALVGLFAISEIVSRSQVAHLEATREDEFVDTKLPFSTITRYLKTITKSSAIGTFIGAVPGTGPAIASFLSYSEAKRSSRNKEEFGNGSLDGVAAAEAGNNGATGATLIPLLTLGIPGDITVAILLGALTIQGLAPGPQLFTESADIVYAIMMGLIFINVIMYIQGRLAARWFARVSSVPMNVLVPVLLVLCFVGSFAVNNSLFDTHLMMLFGLIGYVATRFGFPVTPMLLGIVLGPIAESGLRRGLLVSDGDWTIFFTRPICLTFIVLAAISFALPLIGPYIARRRSGRGEASS